MGPAKRAGCRCIRARFSALKTHAELDLLGPGDELSGVVAAVGGLPTCRSLVGLGPDEEASDRQWLIYSFSCINSVAQDLGDLG